CASLDQCLRSDANPYRHTDGDEIFYGDCADVAYFLRGYYAWKNGLPFSHASLMQTANGAPEDHRYSKAGNVVSERRYAWRADGAPIDAPRFLRRIVNEVSTAMFRTHPETGGGTSFDDFYPVKIERGVVRPGMIAYDIYGHVGLIYDIEASGRVHIMASHPDLSLTRTVYGPNFIRSGPELGAGLKAWRPIRKTGGRAVAATNAELADFSMEQFFGTVPHPEGRWDLGEFRYEDRTLDYYAYVRRVLAAPDYAYNPVTELSDAIDAICVNIKARSVAVDRAYEAGLHLRPHPGRLPPNIYGTYGDWEAYSTPSRDARLKNNFVELRRLAEDLVTRHAQGDPSLSYEGADLPADLLAAFSDRAEACKFVYTKSDGERLRLRFHHVMERLFDLSFDPYHCPERRWGATGAEAAACADGPDKAAWYAAQVYLRNQVQRVYDVKMDFTLTEMKSPSEGGLGWEVAPDVDTLGYLKSLQRVETAMAQ
ncbi:MAG: hypothetical protein AAGC95_18445, partial [Pseudomonadota bacterium]